MKRDILICILLTLITCGLYSIYWFIVITDETNSLAGEPDTSGIMALILTIITCGLYGIFWAYKRGEKIDIAKQKRNIPAGNSGILYLILYLISRIVTLALLQHEVNTLVKV
ncbi:DUF4234 domain-containing protein [Mobilitalea sibirica]|uniref:DUF4234 domain-containing protein n=1 Tax=Mobilitalea sibirica TaxID=1462919 RepID=A0A8J7HC35_9FIRM|nr:DUF4234 domain-containing protein [Mobilitalea sibirica]MBH1941741.1 DUF4234 domain-containing protein [Mobilitalea sibirica]